MFSWNGFIIGLTMVGIGVWGVKYTFWIHNQTGPVDFIERYTGSGSTYGIFKILFLILIILGAITATGFGNNVMEFLLSPLAGLFKRDQ